MTKPSKAYVFVMYNLSGIQKGIQATHAVAELSLTGSKAYEDWAKNHKTLILLNGGTSTSPEQAEKFGWEQGSMENILDTLKAIRIEHAPFYEPDLNFALSAIAMVVEDDCAPLLRSWLNTFKLA